MGDLIERGSTVCICVMRAKDLTVTHPNARHKYIIINRIVRLSSFLENNSTVLFST